MNKRFKGSGFDERIVSYTKYLIDSVNQFLKVNISAVRENTDAIISRRDHVNDCAESAIESRMINNFF
jgi:hypothetical protein